MKTKLCAGCKKEFLPVIVRDGKKKYLSGRSYCFECSPFGLNRAKGVIRTKNSKQCAKCGKFFPYAIVANGRIRKLYTRNYCLECSPLDGGNNRNLHRTTKICPNCMEDKPLEEFYPRGKRRYPYCRPCTTIVNRKNLFKRKLKIIEYLGGKCCKCGYNRCATALDCHHLDSTSKERTIAHFKMSFNKIKPELEKCILVCSNCHREIHAKPIHFLHK